MTLLSAARRTALAILVCSLLAMPRAANCQVGGGGGAGGGGNVTSVGGFFQNRVGGVLVDADGMLQNMETDELGKLAQLRRKALAEIPDDLAAPSELRKVSLRGLEAAIAEHLAKPDAKETPLPEAIRHLAGLQRIQYIFAYPEEGDIVLAGPAEGWRVDAAGNVIGAHSGRPVMQLEDLLIALRTVDHATRTTISCSIDPTPEGVARLQKFFDGRTDIGQPKQTLATIEESLGPQNVTITGVPAESRFARVLLAADYRMKRLGMNFEKSPVAGLTSYLQMVKAGDQGNMMPRWWLAPNYKPVLRDRDGLAFELRGGSVRVMTEDSFFAANGVRTTSGQASPVAQKWADNMTQHYDQLARELPIFAELQNMMDLAVTAALIHRENLLGKAGHSLTLLTSPSDVPTAAAPTPKQVPSQASFVKRGKNYIISASGGVEINSMQIASQTEEASAPGDARQRETRPTDAAHTWWWD